MQKGEIQGVICAHTLGELYAVLPSLPLRPRNSPSLAWQLIQENVLSCLKVVSLSKTDYVRVLQLLASRHIAGGSTYDALIGQTGLKSMVTRVMTLNPEDFHMACPHLSQLVFSPS